MSGRKFKIRKKFISFTIYNQKRKSYMMYVLNLGTNTYLNIDQKTMMYSSFISFIFATDFGLVVFLLTFLWVHSLSLHGI